MPTVKIWTDAEVDAVPRLKAVFEDIRKKGYLKVRIDGEVKDLVAKMQVDRYKIHDIEVVVDRLAVTSRPAVAR